MTDMIDGGQPSEPIAAPEASSEPVAQPKSEAPAFEVTPRGSIDRAFAKLEAQDAPAVEGAPEGEGQKRGPDGKFVAKEAAPAEAVKPEGVEKPVEKPVETDQNKTPFSEPPARLSADAKAAWSAVPDAVKAEVHRAVTEMTAGIEKHRAAAQEWEGLSEFDTLAKQHNTSVKAALQNYTRLDTEMAKDPVRGLDLIAQQFGLSLRQVAQHVLNQPADQQQTHNDATVNALRQEINILKQQLGGVTSTIQEQRITATQREVEAFAADKPRFEELSPTIAELLKSGMAKTLPDAYGMAERLNPAPAAPETLAPAAPAAPKPDLTAQTRKGSLSLNGAPSSGSNPANRKPPSSAREALDRAFATHGLG